jgi:hypothetical protein
MASLAIQANMHTNACIHASARPNETRRVRSQMHDRPIDGGTANPMAILLYVGVGSIYQYIDTFNHLSHHLYYIKYSMHLHRF